DFEQAIAHTGTKFRANVARRMRNLERTGPVRLVRTEEADPEWLDRFFTLEATGWKGRQGSAIACDLTRRAYYEALAAEAARHGYLTLYALECGVEPIAMHFGLTINGRYLVPKLAYDETRHEFGPGHLLIREILRDGVARGLTEFDFLGDTAPWKREWAPAERAYYHVYIFGNNAMGRLAHAVRFRLLPTGRRIQSKLLLPFAIQSLPSSVLN
ncbi:MAG TPA: GNAT family N-acetyltransferase, partial [Thermomicrobiales bacterium]|nr:GNAT family N-acetyltransferase [Thermomicrobiales bacterium]